MFTPVLPDNPTAAVVKEQLRAAGDYINGLRASDKRDDNWKADMRSAVEFIHLADPMLTAIERSAPAPEVGPLGGAVPQNTGRSTLGEQFVTADTFIGAGEGWGGTASVEMEARGSVFSNNHQFRIDTGSGSAGAFLPQGQPIAPQPRQMRMFLRDVLDVVETGLSAVPYIRETDPAGTELGASSVAEGAPKPNVAMSWSLDEANVRKIAAWVEVTSEVLDDAATVRGYIDGRLAYLLAVREEQQILNGSGVTPQLKGILNFAGVQTESGADHAAVLGKAIGKVENVDGEVNGIVINPISFWTMITTRNANQFDGAAGDNVGLPFAGAPQGIWGVTTIRSRALAQGKAIVGSWNLGATLFDRMSTRIVAGNQHSDYFVNNKVAILAEERVALAVHRPDFFVNVTLS